MIKTSRKTTVIDITPAWWGSWDARSWAKNAKALCAGLESVAADGGPMHDLTGCFIDIVFGLRHVAATLVVLTEVSDDQLEQQRQALVLALDKSDPFATSGDPPHERAAALDAQAKGIDSLLAAVSRSNTIHVNVERRGPDAVDLPAA